MVGSKIRPLLVISNSDYNKRYADIVVLKVSSSKENPFPYNVDISQKDLAFGTLRNESTIMVDFPVTLEKEEVLVKIAHLSQSKLLAVKQKLKELYQL